VRKYNEALDSRGSCNAILMRFINVYERIKTELKVMKSGFNNQVI